MTEITSNNDTRISAGEVVLLFSAPWCGNCKMAHPMFEKKAAKLADTVTVLEVDCDKFPDVAKNYGITKLPAAVKLSDGIVESKVFGTPDVLGLLA